MSVSDSVHHFPGRAECLRRDAEASDIATVTRVALDATDAFRAVWEPLSAEVTLFVLDGEDPFAASLVDVAKPHRMLVKASLGEGVGVSAMMKDPVTTAVNELSRPAIAEWLKNASTDVVTEQGQHAEWTELAFRACRAWVGPPDWRTGESELRLSLGGSTGKVVVPIERTPSGAWLSGPRKPAFDQPPFEIRFTHESGSVMLQLSRHYGYWLDRSEPAARRLDDVMDQLHRTGWDEWRRDS